MKRKIIILSLVLLFFIPSVFSMSGSGTPSDPYIIYDISDMQSIDDGDLSAYYELANNIDASSSHSWNGGSGFKPIGNNTNPFSGHFDGKGYVITNLYMNNPIREQYTSLFEYMINDGTIQNFGIEDSYVYEDSSPYASILLGWNNGTVWRCWVNNGTVKGYDYVAGLVNWNEGSGIIKESYFIGNVNATSGTFYGAGLFGTNNGGHVNCSYSLGTIYGYPSGGSFLGYAGGLGLNNKNNGIVSECYSGMNINAVSVGGLITQNGHATSSGYIYDSYANGTLNIGSWGGGLVGYNTGGDYQAPAYNIRSYSSSEIIGGCSYSCSGLLGVNNCWGYQNCVQYSYFDNETSGGYYGCCNGRYTWQMKKELTFETWDFDSVWNIEEDMTYPQLSCIWGTGEVEPPFSCGENIGLCFDNILCFIESILLSTIGMILCFQPAFILIFVVAIASAILLAMKNALN